MPKNVYAQKEIQKEMSAGAALLADSVKMSLGPKGRNTILDCSPAGPLVTNDGSAIAKALDLKNPARAMGAGILREMSSQVRSLVGDGTTTAVVLAERMIREGYRNLAAGANPVELGRGIQGAARLAASSIRKLARPIEGGEMAGQVAAVSSSDQEIGKLIGEALERVGADGVITVEESGTPATTLEIFEEIKFHRGYLSPEMITDRETEAVVFTNPYILVTDEKINSAGKLLPILEQAAAGPRPLFIIAEGLEGEARALLITNIRRGTVKAAAVNAPAYGDGRRARLSDLAILTGAVFVSGDTGISLSEVTLGMLGSAAHVRADRNSTVISRGGGAPESIRIRKEALKRRIRETDYEFEREQLEGRLAEFFGGAASIRVGGIAGTEMKERKCHIEAALHASRAAIEEGVVPGGGTAYLHIRPAVRAYADTLSGDRKTGAEIVLRVLEEPFRQIAENAGLSGDMILAQMQDCPAGTGFDVLQGRFVPMIEAGLIDSAKVSRTALLSAASAGAVFLTAGAGVTEI